MNKSELDAKRDEITEKVKALVEKYSDIAEVETDFYNADVFADIAIFFVNVRDGKNLGKKEKELRRKVISLVEEYKDFAVYFTDIESYEVNCYIDLGIDFRAVKTDEFDEMIKEFESSKAFKLKGTTYIIKKADFYEYAAGVLVDVNELDDKGNFVKSFKWNFNNIGCMKNIELIK